MKVFRSSGGDSAYSQMFMNEDDEAPEPDSAASKFGEEVSDSISKKVVFLTLVLLGVVPLFMPLDILGKADGIKIIEVCSPSLPFAPRRKPTTLMAVCNPCRPPAASACCRV
jgi:hypothetical protein|eukprot:COSAG02_NODE_1755_length_11052_cov_67.877842_7_plen_112_part_00